MKTSEKIMALTLPVLTIPSLQPMYAQKSEKPNFLVILVDDFGWTDLGCYGSTFYETPNIDKLASEGIRFTNGYASCPVSSPSRAGIQTGQYPNRTGVTDWLPGRQAYEKPCATDRWISPPLPVGMNLNKITIAENLKSAGYTTFFAGKWHLGETPGYWPEHQGYDINIGGCYLGSPHKNAKDDANGYFAPYGNPRLEDGPAGEYLPERLTRETLHFIEKNKDKPFLAFLSFYLVHNPLQGKQDLIDKYMKKREKMGIDKSNEMNLHPSWAKYATCGESYKERLIQGNPVYAAMVQALDDNVGKILNYLQQSGLDKNTVIVFTSDNGGLSTAEGSPTSNLPLRGGKGWLYEGGIRVPYIFRYPTEKKKGFVNSMPISNIDVLPTMLAFAGIKPLQGDTIDGMNLLPYMEKSTYPERTLFWDYPHYSNQGGDPGSVIRKGNYKLIDNYETGRLELYDLKNDQGEQHDLSKQLPRLRDQLFKELTSWRKQTHSKTMSPNPIWNHEEPDNR